MIQDADQFVAEAFRRLTVEQQRALEADGQPQKLTSAMRSIMGVWYGLYQKATDEPGHGHALELATGEFIKRLEQLERGRKYRLGSLSESIPKGLAHVGGHFEQLETHLPELLTKVNRPDATGGQILILQSHAEATGTLAWFRDGDLERMRQFFAAESALEIHRVRHTRSWGTTLPNAETVLRAVVSDWEPVIAEFGEAETTYVNPPSIENVKSREYHTFQAILAIRGDMERLAARAAVALSRPSELHLKTHVIDHRFFLALATSNVEDMTLALNELASPKIALQRNRDAGGFVRWFFQPHATLYAKLAHRRGFDVQVSSDFVPSQWLPVRPLTFQDPYLARFGIGVPGAPPT